MLLEDRVYVCFPEHINQGVYEVRLDMSVFLSQPDALGWQTFSIPSLSADMCTNATGAFDFSLTIPSGEDMDVPSAQFDSGECIVVEKRQKGSFQGNFLTNECLLLRLRLKAAIHPLENWDSAITIYTTITYDPALGTRLKHSVSLTANHLDDIFAERVTMSILVKHGPREGGIYRLQSGQCLVQLFEDKSAATAGSRGPVEIVIERDFWDVDKRLGLEFTCRYPDMEKISISLPVIKPKSGKVLSEKIWALKPSPPLRFEAVSRPLLSTWEVRKQTIAQRELLCFTRMKMPALYPYGLADEANFQLRRLNPTLFNGSPVWNTPAEGPCNIIPSLEMIVDILPGKRIECRMSFDLEIGDHDRIIQVDAIGWQPKYALANGHLCTKTYAPWWDDSSRMSMFRSPWMQSGQKLRMELSFVVHRHVGDCTADRGDWIKLSYALPRVTDKFILGGSVTCNYNDAVVAVHGAAAYEELRFARGKNCERLPSLERDYMTRLVYWMMTPAGRTQPRLSEPPSVAHRTRFSGGLPLQPRLIHFEDEDLDTSNDGDDEGNGSDLPAPGTLAASQSIASPVKALGDFVESKAQKVEIIARHALKTAASDTGSEITARSDKCDSLHSANDDVPLVDGTKRAVQEPKRDDKNGTRSGRAGDTRGLSDEHGSQDKNRGVSSNEALERRSPMQYLIRFLILGCIACLVVPWAYFGGQPAQAVQSVVSNVFAGSGQMFLGDLDTPPAQPIAPTAGVLEVSALREMEEDMGQFVDIEVPESDRSGHSWRDRLDLALGWRPVS